MNNFNLIGKIERFSFQNKVAYITICNKHGRDEYSYIEVTSFSPEFIAKHFYKGKWIAINGHIKTSSFKKGDQTIYKTDLIADNVYFIGDPTSLDKDLSETFKNGAQNIQPL